MVFHSTAEQVSASPLALGRPRGLSRPGSSAGARAQPHHGNARACRPALGAGKHRGKEAAARDCGRPEPAPGLRRNPPRRSRASSPAFLLRHSHGRPTPRGGGGGPSSAAGRRHCEPPPPLGAAILCPPRTARAPPSCALPVRRVGHGGVAVPPAPLPGGRRGRRRPAAGGSAALRGPQHPPGQGLGRAQPRQRGGRHSRLRLPAGAGARPGAPPGLPGRAGERGPRGAAGDGAPLLGRGGTDRGTASGAARAPPPAGTRRHSAALPAPAAPRALPAVAVGTGSAGSRRGGRGEASSAGDSGAAGRWPSCRSSCLVNNEAEGFSRYTEQSGGVSGCGRVRSGKR